MTILPESFLKCMTAADRKAIGQMTTEEAMSKCEAKNERALQGQIVQYLRLKGIEPLWHRTDKKSAATVGWPDITFAAQKWMQGTYGMTCETIPCAWEVKYGPGQLSAEQKQMAIRLQSPPNCWRWRVIRSLQEAIAELRDIGIE